MKKALWTKIVGCLALSALLVNLAACGSSGSSQAGSTGSTGTATEGGQTLKVLLSEEPGEGDALKTALDAWAAETGNTIETMIISHDDQLTKFPSMAKNNDLPDLISTTRLHQLYPEEFVDVSTFMDTSMFNESALKIVGKSFSSDAITGVPEQFTITCMYYNADAFAAAGIEVPTAENPWTWEELYANAKIIQEASGLKYGFAADVSRARYDILMYANGGSMVVEDGDSFAVAINSAQNIATLESFIEANDNGTMPKAIWAGGSTDNPVEYFKNGDVAILLSGSWNYNTFATEITKFDFSVMTTPEGTAGQAAIIGGAALAVPENGKNSALAIEFLQWLYQEENFQTYLQNHKGLSVLNDVMYQPDEDKAVADFAVMQNELNYVTDTFMVDESSSWRVYKDNEYRDYIKRAVAGELTAEEALTRFAQELAESSEWEIA